MTFRYKEGDIVLESLNIFHEYDVNNFVNLSSKKLGLNESTPNKKITYYSDMIKRTLEDFKNLTLDKSLVNDFKMNYNKIINNLASSDVSHKSIEYDDVKDIRPKYLSLFLRQVGEEMDSISKGGKSKIDFLTMKKVKSDIVSTTLNIDIVRMGIPKPNFNSVILTKTQIDAEVIPFINNFDRKKEIIIKQSIEALKAVQDGEDFFNYGNDIISKEEPNKYKYDLLRNVIDIIAYVTYMTVHRMENYISYAIEIGKAYNTITNNINISEASVENLAGVNNDSTNAVADSLIKGDASVFVTMANHIYELYEGKIRSDMQISDVYDGKYQQGETNYKKDVYDDVCKAFISIDQGLGIISSRIDEYILLQNNMINNAGFGMPLEARFKGTLDNIKDLSDVEPSILLNYRERMDIPVFTRAIAEVKDYPRNMENLASVISKTKTRLNVLKELIESDFHGELKNETNLVNLRFWYNEFVEQFNKFVNIIAGSFMNRLKRLELVLERSSYAPTTNESYLVDDVDFLHIAFESIYDLSCDLQEEEINALESSYYTLKKIKEGKLLLEADGEPANSTTPVVVDNNTNNTTGNTGNTTNNTTKTANGTNALQNILNNIRNFFNKLINNFSNTVGKWKQSNYMKGVENSREILENRSYSNVSVTMLPYQQTMSFKTLQESLERNISNFTVAMNEISKKKNPSEAEIYSSLFKLDGVTVTPENAKEQFINYYKTKSAKLAEPVTISNSALKELVLTELLPYIDGFDNFYNDINKKLQNAQKTVEESLNKINTQTPQAEQNRTVSPTQQPQTNAQQTPTATTGQVKKESYSSYTRGSVFYEEESVNGNNQQQHKDPNSVIVKAIEIYIGSVLNALRDRNNDYMKVLYNLIPKVKNNQNEQQNQQAPNPQPQQQIQQQTQQQPEGQAQQQNQPNG